MVAPAVLIGLVLAKKAAAAAVYAAGKSYGWPRVYRRLAERINRHAPATQRVFIRGATRTAFRAPNQAYQILSESSVWTTAQSYLTTLRTSGLVGRMAASAVDDVLKRGPKWFEEFASSASADARASAVRSAPKATHTAGMRGAGDAQNLQ